jgi:hypothetical protein
MADGFMLYTLILIFRTLKAYAMMFEYLVHFQASNSQEKHRFTLQVAVKAAVAKMQDQKIKVALARSTDTANYLGIVDQKMCSIVFRHTPTCPVL